MARPIVSPRDFPPAWRLRYAIMVKALRKTRLYASNREIRDRVLEMVQDAIWSRERSKQ